MPDAPRPPAIIIFGDEPYKRSLTLKQELATLLPPQIDRTMALYEYYGDRSGTQGGTTFAAVADDLRTLSFMSDRRVVVVREADVFIQSNREALERYAAAPAPGSTLILECRTFPKTTRLYKALIKIGARLHECRKLAARDIVPFVVDEARRRKKRIDGAAARRLADLIGGEQGALASEIEKLSLFVGERPSITENDVRDLVGQSREEKIFAVMDAALAGRAEQALSLWRAVLATDPAAAFKAVGGVAYVIRRLLSAHRMVAEGMPVRAIAPKVMMFRREAELSEQLRRLSVARLQRLLARLAELDMQAKLGLRSMDTGVEGVLIEVAAAAA